MITLLFVSLLIVLEVGSLPSIDQTTLDGFNKNQSGNIIVTMINSTLSLLDGFEPRRFLTRHERLKTIVTDLQEFAKTTQERVMKVLDTEQLLKGFRIESLWITNQIIIWGADLDLVSKLMKLEDILEIKEEAFIPLDEPMDLQILDNLTETNVKEQGWGVQQVQAPDVWNLGETGEGIIVCSIDTGVRASHEALRNNFLGEFGWYDAVQKISEPYDDFGHGTHVMGVIAGSKNIGVAPGSKWSACKACGPGGCSEFLLLVCGQWVACPTFRNGSLSNCSATPHVVSNSWGGEIGNIWYSGVAKVWHMAGIISVFAIGNIGPACGTANSPGDYDNVIGVGASCRNHTVARFSSSGPSKIATRVKPDVSAPGHKILSAYHRHDTAYAILSGSSTASPCAAGVVALLLGKKKSLSFVDVLSALQAGSGRTKSSGYACSDKDDSHFPNYHAGYGRINARKSLERLAYR
ncbi:unnamed protein product [Allacma fusca]|uniref:Peptidase S8/S53 domain-containing protein n=1 Tax=Allacma fusca TaxID=39272 RepID=A0A8J2PIE5_9HEXA|nr:unnamed protein product [Allacma fusca]